MPRVNDERYINNTYLASISESYENDTRFANIPLEDKERILERIRYRVSQVIYTDERGDGEKLMSQDLLNLEKFPGIPLSAISDLGISFLYGCMYKKLERISPIFLYSGVRIPQDDSSPELTNEYLEMIADVTKYLIKEIASGFNLQNSAKQSGGSTSNKELKSNLKRKERSELEGATVQRK